ncbi:MAG: methionyl-tRNA formyltransferase [Chthoniobacterales bacterium]|nr:methionyl-tRNA formyltransferase [Chthoniobacterales bacterium]MCX7714062.1 methionyl-tRNA formyltransferase [Chthoniobacterales bacterium]
MRVVYLGSGEIGLPTLRFLAQTSWVELCAVITAPDKPAGRGHRLTPCPVAILAREIGLPLQQPKNFHSRENLDFLRSLRPDLFIVFAFGKILSGEALRIPALAALNLHASLLPRHRGASPIQSAILSGDAVTGITVMFMEEELDAGEILLSKEILIDKEETTASLTEKISLLAPEALREALDLLRRGEAPRMKQDPALVTWCEKIRKEDAEIRWDEPAELIFRKVRAFNPWPVSYTWLPRPGFGKKSLMLKVWRAYPGGSDIPSCLSQPVGSVVSTSHGELAVQTGEGILRILEVQPEGKKKMHISDFLRGYSVEVGMKLG